MENLPSNVLDFNNNELNNNGASSNKGSSSNSSDSCSSGTSSKFSDLLRCHDEPINVTLETAEEQDVLDDPSLKQCLMKPLSYQKFHQAYKSLSGEVVRNTNILFKSFMC